MPEDVKYCVHRLERCNKSWRGLIFTDRDKKLIDDNENAYYDPNNDSTPKDDVFDHDDYVSKNFLARVNDRNDTYENPNFVNANYYKPLEEDKEQKDNYEEETPKDVEDTKNGDDDDHHKKQSKIQDCMKKTPKLQEWTRKL